VILQSIWCALARQNQFHVYIYCTTGDEGLDPHTMASRTSTCGIHTHKPNNLSVPSASVLVADITQDEGGSLPGILLPNQVISPPALLSLAKNISYTLEC
jgi:hypothetical protein